MIREKISEALKSAMKSSNKLETMTLRYINSAIKQKDIDVARARGDQMITDEEVLDLLQKQIKSRRESATLCDQGCRHDLAEKEMAEITIIERFLPKALSEDETKAAVVKLIESLEAKSMKDMGRVMAAIKSKYAGQLDVSKVSAIVKESLKS